MTRPLALVLFALPVFAQNAQLSRELARTVGYHGVAISPDGARIAWTESTAAADNPLLVVAPVAGAAATEPVKLGATRNRTDSDPAWSPDSKTLAFFSTAGEMNQPELWTVSAAGSNARKRTHLNGYAARPHWSHDGKRIAFLYIEGAGGGGPLFAAPAMTGVIDAKIENQRIAVLDVASGKLHDGSPADLHVYDFDWSPDDSSFAATAAPGPGDNNWWIAKLYVFDAAGKATPIYTPELQIAIPRWSPDGKNIGFIEGLMSDEGFHGGDLMTIAATGGAPANHTRNRTTSPSSLVWTAPDRILFTESAGGGSAISELRLSDSSIETLWRGDEDIHSGGNFPNFAIARDGRTAVAARSSFEQPPAIWAGRIGEWRQVTHANDGLQAPWGHAESLEWTNDGLHVQGWLLAPKDVQPGKQYPMVVMVHGGPSGCTKPSWPERDGLFAPLASGGYYVLMPNPRGSYGEGEAFTRANVKDLGGGDLRDILAGVDAALAKHPDIDPHRLGLTGWSYGGFMTMFGVTQTNRFQAAMAGAGIANWQSYYGENLIDRWMIPFFGASVYDDPAVYAKSSAINFIRNVKTPTLILVGERDAECPSPQSFEFWHALRTLGVETELVVYAGEGHMFVQPKNRLDMMDRTLAWFDKHLK